ncbi:hypothetical protein Pjdr2_2481 [Paenibacillus sp. JDR-2]|nr:hypothetical protein Pjdr2_2481 [Paenibacillus sp. JDR-2]
MNLTDYVFGMQSSGCRIRFRLLLGSREKRFIKSVFCKKYTVF